MTANEQRRHRYKEDSEYREACRARSRVRYWAVTPEERARKVVQAKAWAESNPERRRNIVNRWRQEHPEQVRANARVQNATPAAKMRVRLYGMRRRTGRPSVRLDPETRVYAETLIGSPCAYCWKPADTLDQVEPLDRGGANTADNLTAACRACNSAKSNRSLLTFLLEQRS